MQIPFPMPKEKMDIGTLYRKAFASYKPDPPAGLWKAVQQQIPASSGSFGFSGLKVLLWGGAVASLVTLAVWMSPSPEDIAPTNTEMIAEDVQTNIPGLPSPEVNKQEVAAKEPAVTPPNSEERVAEAVKTDKPETSIVSAPVEENTVEKKAVDKKPDKQVEKPEPKPVESPEVKAEEQKPLEKPGSEDAWERHRIRSGSRTNPASFRISFSETQTICRGESVKIGAANGVAYEWEDGQTTDSILVTPDYTTVYHLTVIRQDDRKAEARIRVNVEECANIFIPNAFTPNNDGLNDAFVVKGSGIVAYHIIIKTQEGKTVFESQDISTSWDGSFAGNELETGTYIYRIDYVDEYGNAEVRNGYILLFR